MSFRKRNVAIATSSSQNVQTSSKNVTSIPRPPGTRPSPVDGRLTTSTGTPSLDNLLAGHAGLALGNSLLIEESGTTDFAGVLLRYYAAEGVVQGHRIHVVGVGEGWSRELPGLVGAAAEGENKEKDKMKIAWRYERLGEHGSGSRAPVPDRGPTSGSTKDTSREPQAFCHTFDLTKRLSIPSPSPFTFIPPAPSDPKASPLIHILSRVESQITTASISTIHRLIIPTILSPALYPSDAAHPQHILQFFHALRGLLRSYPNQLTAITTIPLELYPRTSGLTRWMELLNDGVLELAPFPHLMDLAPSLATSGAATAQEDQPQGMFKVHSLPISHEKGGGGVGSSSVGDDLAFTVSRRKFVIKPFSLPPVDGDTEAQKGNPSGGEGKQTAIDIDF